MDTVCIEKKILNPLKWTAETPNLYDLITESRVEERGRKVDQGGINPSGRFP